MATVWRRGIGCRRQASGLTSGVEPFEACVVGFKSCGCDRHGSGNSGYLCQGHSRFAAFGGRLGGCASPEENISRWTDVAGSKAGHVSNRGH